MKTRIYGSWIIAMMVMVSPCWGGTLKISRVWPEKIVCRPGETAKIEVVVTNAEKSSLTQTVSLAVRYGLDQKDVLPDKSIIVPAGGKETAKFTYAVPKDRKWGHEVVASVADDKGAAQSTGHEYFTVGDNPWELGHYISRFGMRGAKKSGWADRCVLNFRKTYVTTLEGFSWQPSVFDEMTPDTNIWRSGQGGNKEGKEDWQYLIQRAHENGMSVITYIQCVGYGPVGLEFMRKHPDWWGYGWPEKGRPPASFFNVDALAALQENPDAEKMGTAGGFVTGVFLPNKPQVGDYWINEVIKSVEMFGWDGIRSDGNPSIAGGYDYTGKLYEVKDPDEANAEFLGKVRYELTKKFPEFKFGWNSGEVLFNKAGDIILPKQAGKMIPGSYMLWESFNSAPKPGNPLHDWKKTAGILQHRTDQVRKQGGFLHEGWMPGNSRYLEAIVCACGGHVDGYGYEYIDKTLNYRRFQFRWAEFLWDIALRYVHPATEAVSVESSAPLWWQDFAQTRDLPGGKKRIIVHLINMPVNDDDAWADKPPEPVKNVHVTFGVPAGMKLNKLVVLSPDTEGDVVPVTPSSDSSITIPEVKIWNMVVAEYGG